MLFLFAAFAVQNNIPVDIDAIADSDNHFRAALTSWGEFCAVASWQGPVRMLQIDIVSALLTHSVRHRMAYLLSFNLNLVGTVSVNLYHRLYGQSL